GALATSATGRRIADCRSLRAKRESLPLRPVRASEGREACARGPMGYAARRRGDPLFFTCRMGVLGPK
ncbi:MAG: hypothetical protein O2799_05205, partial [Planctomycetota bacterium]|nr:hypothetical protein [Planctomycetota bacterium]